MRLIERRDLWRQAIAASAVLALAVAGSAQAATLRVCSSGCQYMTISGALAAATSGDRIAIGPGSYEGGFTIERDISLLGAGSGETTIAGGGPVVTVNAGVSATIRDVTITGGDAGGILNVGTLTLRDSIVSGNTASTQGGGISNAGGTLTLRDSMVSGNTTQDDGGGIFNDAGTLTLKGSTVTGNTAHGDGGGIVSLGSVAVLSLMDSTVSGNTAQTSDGGGITNLGASAVLKNSTVSGNTAGGNGGGIANRGTGSVLALIGSTVTGNTAGGVGGGISGGTVTLKNSTVSGNTPDDCAGC
jgi:hypothetical protein